MSASNSRYASIPTATFTTPGGEQIVYRRRRFLPRGESLPLLLEVTVTQGDRLDQIAARTLGDAEAFWRIADANDAMNPQDLTVEPGRSLRVPLPTA